VLRSGKPLRITPADQPELASRLQHFPGKDVVDWLGVPLRTEAGVLGALVVQSYAGGQRYSQQDLELLHFVSNQVAAAIERKRLYEQQEFFALHDPLTGLPNRRLFQDRLQGALQRARRNGSRFALLFLDLNGFKRINDAMGHKAGDQLLQQVGQRLQQRVRGSDTVARLGGDEFVLLLESIGEGDVSGFLQDKILEAFARHFELGVPVVDVHPSIGVAVFPDDGTDERSLLDHADRRMYDCKKARRT
jgi:diguanylate cyclase (GGDEF)-like protein